MTLDHASAATTIDNSNRPGGSQESLDLSDFQHVCDLEVKDVARRLDVAPSTLNGWLRYYEGRPPEQRVLEFHRWRGRLRKWSEAGFRKLETAIHRESPYKAASCRGSRSAPSSLPAGPRRRGSLG